MKVLFEYDLKKIPRTQGINIVQDDDKLIVYLDDLK
jgi:hypothetical protein